MVHQIDLLIDWLIDWCLAPTLAVFQLYRGVNEYYINLDTYNTLRNKTGEVYSIQHYVIKFVSELRQVSVFLRMFRFAPQIKLTATT